MRQLSPEERPRPSTPRDLPRAAWISARACTRSTPLAVLSVPIYAFSILPMTLRGGLYLDRQRTGTVLFARRRPILDGLVIGVCTAAAFALWVACILVFDATTMLLLGLLAYVWLLVGAIIALVQPGGTTLSASGPETPKGERWMVAALAQLPGTRLSAVVLARRLLAGAPRGAVVVAAAATDTLLERYVRAGFTRGLARRVHLIVGEMRGSSEDRAGNRRRKETPPCRS